MGDAFKTKTSPYSFQRLGLEGLKILDRVKELTGLPNNMKLMNPRDVGEVGRDTAKRKEHLKEAIKKEFLASRGTYGPDRTNMVLRKKCEHIGRKKCVQYVAILGLDPYHNKHQIRSLTNSKKACGEENPDIFRDHYFLLVPLLGLSSNINFLRTSEGFLYRFVIKVIVTGEVLSDHMDPYKRVSTIPIFIRRVNTFFIISFCNKCSAFR